MSPSLGDILGAVFGRDEETINRLASARRAREEAAIGPYLSEINRLAEFEMVSFNKPKMVFIPKGVLREIQKDHCAATGKAYSELETISKVMTPYGELEMVGTNTSQICVVSEVPH